MVSKHSVQHALVPWNKDIAAASLARWDEVCAHEGWGEIPCNRPLLRSLFGASWYLTRFLFYSGKEIAELLDQDCAPPGNRLLQEELRVASRGNGDWLENLRIARNRLLLQLTLADLQGMVSQEVLEERLTTTAEAVIRVLLERIGLEELVVLGMGRLGVKEMNYGSDLDLILLYPRDSMNQHREIMTLLRYCQATGPTGKLYDVDVRLRPHGQAGTLISSIATFHDYHLKARETWERQAMTRCRPIQDNKGLGAELLRDLSHVIYAGVPSCASLGADVISLRSRVEQQLANLEGQWEIKRGYGGIMDIDFLAHYLQLCHGAGHPGLQGVGTRQSLREALQQDLLDQCHAPLLECYDFLKRVEGRLRLFEMRPVSHFTSKSLEVLARAMGMSDAEDPPAAMLGKYEGTTNSVRSAFQEVLGRSSEAT